MVVPTLPYLFDHPVEQAVDWCFDSALRMYGGEDAVRPLPNHAGGKMAEKSVSAAAQISWEEYKNERENAREIRRDQNGGSTLSSWFGSNESQSKEKKE